jgi:hypothetical protein
MSERWFLAKIYYSLANIENEEDPNGNTILVDFVRPTVRALKQQGWIRWSTFMRFAEQGYHIRFMVYGDEKVLAENVEPTVQRALQKHRAAHPEVSSRPMQLAPLAVRLNQKWGGAKRDYALRPPDANVMGLMYDTGEDEIFESEEAFTNHYNLQSDACERALDLLALEPRFQARKSFVRLLVDDFLRLTDLTELECYYFLTYLRLEWITYFEIADADLEPSYRVYHEREQRYRAYFQRKQTVDDSLAMLPSHLQALYRDWLDSLRQKLPAVIGRDAAGHLTPHGSLRLLTFFHLMHNRLGVGMMQELHMAYVLAQHYRSYLTAAQVAEADAWARMMRTLAPQNSAGAPVR